MSYSQPSHPPEANSFWYNFENNRETKALDYVKGILLGYKTELIVDIIASGKSEAIALLFHPNATSNIMQSQKNSLSILIMFDLIRRQDWDNYKLFFNKFTHLKRYDKKDNQIIFNQEALTRFKNNSEFPLIELITRSDLPLGYVIDKDTPMNIQEIANITLEKQKLDNLISTTRSTIADKKSLHKI